MSSPRTLSELRAALRRVLLARGEAPDAVTVQSMAAHGGRVVEIRHARPGWHWLPMYISRPTAADASAAAWALVCLRCDEERANARDAVIAAGARLRRARAALAAGGGGE